MARHEKDFCGDGAPLSLEDLLDLLEEETQSARHAAIACYLSAGEGWRDAMKKLGGAFADVEPGLREGKPD